MDVMKSKAGYSESQIRLVLSGLSNASHSHRISAIKTFRDYIFKYKPEVCGKNFMSKY